MAKKSKKKVTKKREAKSSRQSSSRQSKGERTCSVCNTIVEGNRGTCPECDSPLE